MPNMTARIIREIIQVAEQNIQTLEIQKRLDGEHAPTQAEFASIERVQAVLRNTMQALLPEVMEPLAGNILLFPSSFKHQ